MLPHSCERGGRRGKKRKGEEAQEKSNEFQRCTLPPTAPMTRYRNVLESATPTDPSRDANIALKFRFSFLLPGKAPQRIAKMAV